MTGAGKLRVCVLQSSVEGCSSDLAGGIDPYRRPEVYDTAGEFEWSHVYTRKATSAAQLLQLAAAGAHDVYLNLCDGAWDEDRAGRDVVEALERLNMPYTGANLQFYEPTKVEMKMAAQYYGVKVPPWVHIKPGPGREEAGIAAVLAPPERGGLRFPLIVKHPSGYSSVGMTRSSKVTDEAGLREQVGLLLRRFGGALVEEFIPGREFTVLVVEEPSGAAAMAAAAAANAAAASNGSSTAATDGLADANDLVLRLDPDLCAFRAVAYTPVECAFGPGEDFKHFDLKWNDYDSMQWTPCKEPELAEALKTAARNTFIATRGVSYGRCDFRVDPSGRVFLLEINPNCGVLYSPGEHGSADVILSLDPKYDHMHFIRTILASALERHRMRQKKVEPAFFPKPQRAPALAASAEAPPPQPAAAGANGSSGAAAAASANGSSPHGGGAGADERGTGGGAGGWGLMALVPIRKGETIQRNEQRKAVVASRGFVYRCWPQGSRQREWFEAFAFPFSEEVFVTWSDDPADWAPLNHSCDPSAWMVGLDAVARRDIAPGEQITLDYGTFYTEDMAPFDCECGAACCRGRVTGTDHMSDHVGLKYGNHVSPYVAEKRRRAQLWPQAPGARRPTGEPAPERAG